MVSTWGLAASKWLIGLSAAATLAAPAAAAVVIDQPINQAGIQVLAFSPVGQSFTAVTDSLNSIGVSLQNFNVANPVWIADRTVTLRLFDQADLTGNTLGQGTVDVAAILGDADGVTGMIDFGFGSVTLAVGQSYSFQVVADTARWGIRTSYITNAYAGGRAYYTAPFPGYEADSANSDLRFRVSAVPEPEAAWMLLAGLLLLAGCGAISGRRSAVGPRP